MRRRPSSPPTAAPSRPRLAADLPAGPVRDRIVKLASPRALLPVATAASAVSVTRLLNADGKTVARLIVDCSTVTRAGQTVVLPAAAGHRRSPRLSRPGPPGRAARWPTLPASSRPDAARSSTPCTPSAATRRTTATASPRRSPREQPASVAVSTLLLGLLDTMERNVDGVLRDIDTEFLHDLRVAARRSRSAIKLLGDVLPDGLGGRYAAEFKWLGDLTTPIRDLDVHLLGFGSMTRQLVAASPADLEPFRAFLVRRRAREFRRLAAGLRSARFGALAEDWRKALADAQRAAPSAAA